jgi:hypothetical protein
MGEAGVVPEAGSAACPDTTQVREGEGRVKTKRMLAALAGVALTGALLTGCNGGDDDG